MDHQLYDCAFSPAGLIHVWVLLCLVDIGYVGTRVGRHDDDRRAQRAHDESSTPATHPPHRTT